MIKTDEEVKQLVMELLGRRGQMRPVAIAMELVQPTEQIKRVVQGDEFCRVNNGLVQLMLTPAELQERTAATQAKWSDETREERRTVAIAGIKEVREERMVGQMKRDLEAGFNNMWRMVPAAKGMPMPLEQFEFHSERKWRFDFAWPALRVAVEIQGMVNGTPGRHQRTAGYSNDCDKLNAAIELQWFVLQFTSVHLVQQPVQAIEQVVRVLKARSA